MLCLYIDSLPCLVASFLSRYWLDRTLFSLHVHQSFNDFDRSPSRKTKASLTRESSSGYQKEKLQSFPDHSSVIRDINELQNLEHLVSEPASPSQMTSFVECFTQVRPFECSKNEFEDSLFHEQTLRSVRQNTLYTNEKNTPFNAAADSDHNDLQVPKENDDTLVGKQSEIFEPKQDNIDSASDISGQGKSTPLEVKESASNDPLDNIDDEKENRIDPSPRNAHLENKNGFKSFGKLNILYQNRAGKKTNKAEIYRSQT